MKKRLLLLVLSVLGFQSVIGQTIEDDFMNPPAEAKPIMIWQWMDGLITKEGITADLEAYQKAGIGGVQNFQVGGNAQGLVKDTTNAIGSERWQQLMRFAISECSRLGLTYGTHNCPGWSSSAYPTVKPEYSMQKLVWTMVESQGKRRIRLMQPETNFGYFEDIA
ncbi:MAG: DNA-binding protein, partial [Prevotella sp.]|nr:DNA-binding protein [Prevotella sp.]